MGNSLKEKLLNLDKENLCNYITELKTKLSMSGNGNSTKYKELKDKLLLAVTCLAYVKKEPIPSDKRKEFLADVPVSKLIKIAPSKALDNSYDDKIKKLGRHQKNTGVYLWKNGYDPKNLLGIGANGVVWKCNNEKNEKAVKVTCNIRLGPFNIVNAIKDEIYDVNTLQTIISNKCEYEKIDKKTKKKEKKPIDARKYLAISENIVNSSQNNTKHIFESELAQGDLSSQAADIRNKKNIDTIIRIGKEVLKALKVIHDAGYSHNDVKPDNLLLITRNISQAKKAIKENEAKEEKETKEKETKENEAKEKEAKEKEEAKEAVKLADFGAMTKFDNTHKIFVNLKFSPPDWYKTTPEAVKKRDVYALGAVLMFLLIGDKNKSIGKKLAKELWSKGEEHIYNKYNLGGKYCNGKNSDKNKEKVMNLLITIRYMVADSYKQRLTVDEALQRMLKINEN